MMGRKKEKDKTYNQSINDIEEKSIKKTGIIIIFVGIFILLLSIILSGIHSVQDHLIKVLLDTLTAIGTTVITIGAGTVLYSYFDFVHYIKEELTDIVIKNNYIDKLSNDEKKNMIRRLEKQIIYNGDDEKGNLYDFINEEVHTLVKSSYYEYMVLYTHCILKEDKIVKNITRSFALRYDMEEDYEIDLGPLTQCVFKENQDIEEPYRLKRLLINKIDVMEYIERECYKIKTQSEYALAYKYNFKDEKYKKGNFYGETKRISVEMEYTTIVGIDDVAMGFRVFLPCKRFASHFNFNANKMDVIAESFAFKDGKIKGTGLDKDRIQKIYTTGSVHTEILDWILPGDGIIYIISPKNK